MTHKWKTYSVKNFMTSEEEYSEPQYFSTIKEAIKFHGFQYFGDIEGDVIRYSFCDSEGVLYEFRRNDIWQ